MFPIFENKFHIKKFKYTTISRDKMKCACIILNTYSLELIMTELQAFEKETSQWHIYEI